MKIIVKNYFYENNYHIFLDFFLSLVYNKCCEFAKKKESRIPDQELIL